MQGIFLYRRRRTQPSSTPYIRFTEDTAYAGKAASCAILSSKGVFVNQAFDILTCPLCKSAFKQSGAALTCARGHSFDIAREGYINLLSQKRSGDTKDMARARRAFLEQGHYQPLSDAINALLLAHLEHISRPVHILDAGCGEGYYLARLRAALAAHADTRAIGIDTSKEAIRQAAKRSPESLFVVADLWQGLVIADSSLHLLLNIFAPRNAPEFARVTLPGALLLIVIPRPEHLLNLRKTLGLLDIEDQKQQHIEEQFAKWFDVRALSDVTYTMQLSQQAVQQLVMMTPNYWHMSEEQRHTLQNMQDGSETEAAFTVMICIKKKG